MVRQTELSRPQFITTRDATSIFVCVYLVPDRRIVLTSARHPSVDSEDATTRQSTAGVLTLPTAFLGLESNFPPNRTRTTEDLSPRATPDGSHHLLSYLRHLESWSGSGQDVQPAEVPIRRARTANVSTKKGCCQGATSVAGTSQITKLSGS